MSMQRILGVELIGIEPTTLLECHSLVETYAVLYGSCSVCYCLRFSDRGVISLRCYPSFSLSLHIQFTMRGPSVLKALLCAGA